MTLQRFDLLPDSMIAPEYYEVDFCEDGAYTDAEITQSLYDALRAMVVHYGMDEERGELSGVLFNNAREALAKARGES